MWVVIGGLGWMRLIGVSYDFQNFGSMRVDFDRIFRSEHYGFRAETRNSMDLNRI